ncbi:L,D-peptidoglycan transpeptidase YkuD (ErfK/YbiS/YcfS/YnhG family) [Sinorhizobium kostiense]|uniref:L,D-peptidoglycan transpeptidase YkuD (ErfK/YbiS/YcfS/YnhG family) n=1 Tax=Sinorhizobium kostiense TaxID=76747 RepID=A0ABS4R444_9HYPH|nr:L,D-transpeptidase [Sinorhizobium kostiense]MBP2237646.1 L,D-peptidoglycan transpeptidase YkuD (ErfK/YbiS/YcfS/YnhG family) [Sinorhizobium kostiense]
MKRKKKSGVRSDSIVVRAAPRDRKRALVQFGGRTVEAAIGRSGISILKREGDGATPHGTMKLIGGYLRRDRVLLPPSALPMKAIRRGMLWCDAPSHACYNRPVNAPFAASHESMMRDDGLYDVCLVMDWNISSRRRQAGSAIFFHLIRPGYEPTQGCIAVSLPTMRRMIRHMRPGMVVKVV